MSPDLSYFLIGMQARSWRAEVHPEINLSLSRLSSQMQLECLCKEDSMFWSPSKGANMSFYGSQHIGWVQVRS